MRIAKPDTLADLGTLGPSLAESKQLLAGIQREIVAAQARVHAVHRPECRGCGAACRVKDYRHHAIATPFGQVAVRQGSRMMYLWLSICNIWQLIVVTGVERSGRFQ